MAGYHGQSDEFELENEVDSYFNKQFEFVFDEPPQLPPIETVYQSDAYLVPELQEFKADLNFVKSKLNDFDIVDWHKHTRKRSPLCSIMWDMKYSVKGELVTQAFAKFYECLCRYNCVPNNRDTKEFTSLHLCEAPGAFITGLNHYLKLNRPWMKWNWCATTLNPYYEGNPTSNMIIDDRFIFHTLDKWFFGDDYSGDILVATNVAALEEKCKQFPQVDLVSADGSIDCLDVPDIQEEHVSKLVLAEAIIALKILAEGGNFVLKMFTFFEHSSVNLLYFLNCCFEKVYVFKPCTSKPGNSEVYIISLNYKKPSNITSYLDLMFLKLNEPAKALFPLSCIPPHFLSQVKACSLMYMRWQQYIIENNILYYGVDNKAEQNRLRMLNVRVRKTFFEVYKITPIPERHTISYGKNISHLNQFNMNPRTHCGTHTERQIIKSLSGDIKLHILSRKLQNFLDEDLQSFPKRSFSETEGVSMPLKEFIQICHGKPLKCVVNSKFILLPTIKFMTEVINQIQSDADPQTLFTFKDHTLVINEENFRNNQNYESYEKKLFHEIISQILVMDENGYFVVENWLLMTQFFVGFLLILKLFVFEKLEIVGKAKLMFNGMKNDGKTHLKYLRDSIANEIKSLPKDKTVIGLVSIDHLFSEAFYFAIVGYNNQVCLEYCSHFLRNK